MKKEPDLDFSSFRPLSPDFYAGKIEKMYFMSTFQAVSHQIAKEITSIQSDFFLHFHYSDIQFHIIKSKFKATLPVYH